MTDRELRKLRREDLLQILISQQSQIDELTRSLEEKTKALENRQIAIEESGSIAEAALKLNGVFAQAQEAADQYLEESRRRADAIRQEAEEARKQAPLCAMAINWCYCEPWKTAANNSLIAYPAAPKKAYEAVRAALRPVPRNRQQQKARGPLP